MPLGIGLQPEAGFGDRAFLADAGEHVCKRPALGRVVERVVDGDERRARALAELGEPAEAARLVAAIAVRAGEEASRPGAPRRSEAAREPAPA